MSSIVVFLRGDYRTVNQFIEELSAKYLSFTYQKADALGKFIPNTKENYHIRISVRYVPLGAFEIVFPKEHTDLVLTTVLGKKGSLDDWKWLDKWMWPMRKAMHLDKIPDYVDDKKMPVFNEGVHVIPIGFKEDVINPYGNENL